MVWHARGRAVGLFTLVSLAAVAAACTKSPAAPGPSEKATPQIPAPASPAAPSIATLDWNDNVGACGGKCAQQGDPVVVYCGVSTTDGGVVTSTLTLTWESGPTWTSTATSAPGDTLLPSRSYQKGTVVGAAIQVSGDVPGPLRNPTGNVTCTATNAAGVSASRSITVRSGS